MTDFRKPLPQLANAYSDTQKKPPERIGTSHVPGPSLAVFLFQRLLSRHPRLAGIFFRSHIYFINRHKGPIHVCPGKYKGLRLSHRASQLLYSALSLSGLLFHLSGFIRKEFSSCLHKGKTIFRQGGEIRNCSGYTKIKLFPILFVPSKVLCPSMDRRDPRQSQLLDHGI